MMKNFVLIILLINTVKCYCCPDCCCCEEYHTQKNQKNFDKIIDDAIALYNKECPDNMSVDVKIEEFPVTINGLTIENIEEQEHIKDCDLLQSKCECIVNAASYGFNGGRGVDGAIHKNFEFNCEEEKKKLPKVKSPNYVGESICTPCKKKNDSQVSDSIKYIIHTIAPNISGKSAVDNDLRKLYYSCFSTCFNLFLNCKIKSIDFPLVGCGVYGWGLEQFAIGFFEGFFVNFLKSQKEEEILTVKPKFNICVWKPNERNHSMPDTTNTVKLLARYFKNLLDRYNSKIKPPLL